LNTPSAGTPVANARITGLFSDAKAPKVKSVSLPPKPAPTFQPHDRTSLVVYDVLSGKETNLGPGTVTSPAFGENKMVFVAENEAWLVDLGTYARTSLGRANAAFFLDKDRIIIIEFQSRNAIYDIRTGTRTQASASVAAFSDSLVTDQETGNLGGPLRRRGIPGGYVLHLATDVEKAFRLSCLSLPQPESGLCGARLLEEYMVEGKDGQLLYQFRALYAAPAGPHQIVLATSPRCDDGGKQVWCEEVLAKMEMQDPSGPIKYAKGTTNIFLVDLGTGKARFIATARYDPSTRIRPFTWPLTADADYVAWTESYCGQPRGKTRVWERRSGTIRELDGSYWVRLWADRLGIGEFGAKALLDRQSLDYKAVLPENTGDVLWSGDYRYAVAGAPLGHGGLCG
jgi:hypothetical protein